MGNRAPDRAVVFIDGNNWYHYLKEAGVQSTFSLDYKKISEKLLGPRQWIGTRDYIGQVDVRQGAKVYADSRKFLDTLKKTDPRISVHLGRIERHTEENQAAKEILRYVNSLTMQINSQVFSQLVTFVKMHERTTIWVEKAVDVNLAIDMVTMAINDDYDAAYILSADGDFTKAVEFVRGRGKKVYAVSFGMGAQLAGAVNKFIPLKPDWLTDCY